MIQNILTIPKIDIAEANAFSSPFTVGFPAMTAWLGAMHALERKLRSQDFTDFRVNGVGVISNEFELRAIKSGYITSIIGERHPLKKKKNSNEFVSPSFVEEPKCHLTASLLLSFSGVDPDDYDQLKDAVSNELHKMRIAGGIIKKFQKPLIDSLDQYTDNYKADVKRLTARVMPGYALIERRDLMLDAMKEGTDALDALLQAVAVKQECEGDPPPEEHPEKNVAWAKGKRKHEGWIVPIATGFHGLTETGISLNQRDPETPHRFAESLVTLGEFKMAYKINSINDLLWSYDYDSENNLYTCKQLTNK